METRRTRSDGLANRESILAAASELYAEGSSRVPLAAIAKRAGVSRTTISRHFPDRQAIELALMDANLAKVEHYALWLRGKPDGVRQLFRYILQAQFNSKALLPLPEHAAQTATAPLLKRIIAVFTTLTDTSTDQLHEPVSIDDVVIALHLSMLTASRESAMDTETRLRACQLLERAVFGPNES